LPFELISAARTRCTVAPNTGPSIASPIETCKINDVDSLAYLTDVLTRIVNGRPNRDIDQLLPGAYRNQALKAVG
jgi:hypothetical protein